MKKAVKKQDNYLGFSSVVLVILLLVVIVLGLTSLGLYWKLSSLSLAWSDSVSSSVQSAPPVDPAEIQGQASINVLSRNTVENKAPVSNQGVNE